MASIPAENAKTFISYARGDSEFVLTLARDLRQAGANVWLDRFDIPVGKSWPRAVEDALDACGQFLIILSPASIKSDNVMAELDCALDEGKRVFPVLYQECKRPFRIRSAQYADFTANYQKGLSALLEALSTKQMAGNGGREESAPVAEPLVITSPVSIQTAGTVKVNPKDRLEYVWIPPGEFLMGATPGDQEAGEHERPRHPVQISKGFWLGKTPVTVAAYRRFGTKAGPHMPESPPFNPRWNLMQQDHPIVNVNWNEARVYCEWAGGRLPTEAEWEYAARGGKDGLKYPWGDEISPKRANYQSQSTTPVAQFPAQNDWSLQDVAGNVFEWVADWYDEKYYSTLSITGPSRDPQGPEKGQMHVLRGGSWKNLARALRTSYRNWVEPEYKAFNFGFRCASDFLV